MKTTMVRVSRTQEVVVKEHVDVEIIQDDDDALLPYVLAQQLVEAKEAAGHDVDWIEDSETAKRYGTTITAEVLKGSEQLVPEPIEPPATPPRAI